MFRLINPRAIISQITSGSKGFIINYPLSSYTSRINFIPSKLMSSQSNKRRYAPAKHFDWRKNKKTKLAEANAAAENVEGADQKNLSAAEAYEAGVNKVAPPTNERELTAEAGLDAVTPYRNFPYLKQIRKKRQDVVKSLRRIFREVAQQYSRHNNELKAAAIKANAAYAKVSPDLPYASTAGANNIVCPLAHVTESPTLKGYRNKNEFTLGKGIDGLPTAGFQCGRYSDGESRIGSPAGCLSAPDCALAIAELMTAFMREHPIGSQYSCWDKAAHTGFYRLAIVRNSAALGQMMVCIQVNPAALEKEQYEEWKTALTNYLVENTYGGDVSVARAKENGWALPALGPVSAEPTAAGRAFLEQTGHSLTSLLIQEFEGVSNAASDTCPVLTVFGEDSIHDIISGKTFRVNLNSFFQVNVKGAELLYAKAAQWALAPAHDFNMPVAAVLETYAPTSDAYRARVVELVREFKKYQAEQKKIAKAAAAQAAEEAAATAEDGEAGVKKEVEEDEEEENGEEFELEIKDKKVDHGYPVKPLGDVPDAAHANKTLLLDVCCGTGTIGLIMSGMVRKTVGLELVPAAIEDAKVNARLNNVKNASFVCGKAESTIGKVIAQHKDEMSMAVGIVDPPRGGLHNDVVSALRNSKLKRIVYVSCNASTLADNVARLAGPTTRKYPGAPFVPVCAVAVDMFPHTPHCEVVMMLERRPEGQLPPVPVTTAAAATEVAPEAAAATEAAPVVEDVVAEAVEGSTTN